MGWLMYVTGSDLIGSQAFARDMALSKLQDILRISASGEHGSETVVKMNRGRYMRHINQWMELDALLINAKENVALIDCMPGFVQHWMGSMDRAEGREDVVTMNEMEKLLRGIDGFFGTAIVVSQEVETYLDMENAERRMLQNEIGAINRRLANCADEAWHIISGIAIRIK